MCLEAHGSKFMARIMKLEDSRDKAHDGNDYELIITRWTSHHEEHAAGRYQMSLRHYYQMKLLGLFTMAKIMGWSRYITI